MVRKSAKVMRALSAVFRSAYSGKKSMAEESSAGNLPSPRAMPTSREVTLLEIDRRSCLTSGPYVTVPSWSPQRSSAPAK